MTRLESLLLGATEQILRLVQALYCQMTEADRHTLIQGAMTNAQAMAETARETQREAQKTQGDIPPATP